MFRIFSIVVPLLCLSACSLVEYRPNDTIDQIRPNEGYRMQTYMRQNTDDTVFILSFSGGGTRAAAFGYGVLEALSRQKAGNHTMLDAVDLVFDVSGGSVLATYFALHGSDIIPQFEYAFLKQNFQKNALTQAFSLANMPRLASAQFGRSDLMEEQFEAALFGKRTFGDLTRHRKGPFAVISATDMAQGRRVDFTQETFDMLCLDLNDLRLARAVAASSAVPIVLSPVTLNNNGGHCRYRLPERVLAAAESSNRSTAQAAREMIDEAQSFADSTNRPYLHLLDGGLTDNLGLHKMLEQAAIAHENSADITLPRDIKRVVVISINAQNRIVSNIDRSANVPTTGDMINAVVNVPIDQNTKASVQLDQNTKASVQRFRDLVENWNANPPKNQNGETMKLHFVSLNLSDLPEGSLKTQVLNIPTSFYLPEQDIDRLKQAAATLLKQSEEYQTVRREWH